MNEIAFTTLGWCGTVIFVGSFLVKDRVYLHLIGLIGCIVKLIYTWHYSLWPLVVNWALLIIIETVQLFRYRKDHGKPTIEECIRCSE